MSVSSGSKFVSLTRQAVASGESDYMGCSKYTGSNERYITSK